MKLVWTTRAKNDLREIVTRIWHDDPGAAIRMRTRIETTAAYLKLQPWMGRQGAIAGTREAIPHPSYRMVYKVKGETVSILTIVHTSRRWPPGEEA